MCSISSLCSLLRKLDKFRVPLQDRFLLVFKTIEMTGSKTRRRSLSPYTQSLRSPCRETNDPDRSNLKRGLWGRDWRMTQRTIRWNQWKSTLQRNFEINSFHKARCERNENSMYETGLLKARHAQLNKSDLFRVARFPTACKGQQIPLIQEWLEQL